MMLCWGLHLLHALSWLLVMSTQRVTSNCGPGFKKGKSGCDPCPDGEFKSKSSSSSFCTICDNCGEGTTQTSPCTKTSNIICSCREGFTRRHRFACICDKGSGVDSTGKCVKCEDGFFNNGVDEKTTCQKQKDCGPYGVKVPGSATSDVTCYTATEGGPGQTPLVTASSSSPTLKKSTSAITLATAASMNQQLIHRVNSSTLPSWVTTQSKATPAPASHYYNGMVALLITSFFLTILCFTLIFKLAAGLCLNRFKKQIVRADTVCRKPVEESGDKSSSSLVSSTDSSQTFEDV
ncbi:tumor necrosis factor receptor superfamily member 9 [Clupea harengus]|uniref:Tumor necrosis factor receptor superfamily member 9 n=1 Tax=Clupea harengus TaxID=7950 RepID=A0A6P8F373_CLUHA|nr:tumor necrosis factor receptor superfamily member 9 [Clupea harengus]